MPAQKKDKSVEIDIQPIKTEKVQVCILGATPFYCNRVAAKAQHELLYPTGRKTAAQKRVSLKHDPEQEFRDSPYINRDPGAPTLIQMRSTAFKGAMASAAIDLPSAVAKAQINRMTYVEGEFVPIWGIPSLDMDVVRSADMNKTPDIRTRARLNTWASIVTVSFASPMLKGDAIINLLGAAGLIIGVGDYRQEKGKGNNGQFRVVPPDDAEFKAIIANGGRAAQEAAMANPECSTPETEDLLAWYKQARVDRGAAANDAEGDEDEEALGEAAE